MIFNKKLGLKIAESEEEALWENMRKESEILIKQSENNLIVQKAIREMAVEKLKRFKK